MISFLKNSIPTNERYTNLFLFSFLFVTKIIYTFHVDSFGWDGSYYYNIAQNIRDGFGFVTNVSLYHQGMTYLPHPTPIYPLWPYLLGYTSQFFPLESIAYILPMIFYFLTLIIIYIFIKKLLPDKIITTKYFTLNYAHLGILIFFLHSKYFEVTSKPYTEGLAYFLLFVCLTRLASIMHQNKFTLFIEIGFWNAILFLTRSQLIIFLISILFFYFIVFIQSKNIKYFLGILTILASFVTCCIPQLFFLSKKIGQINSSTLIFFDQYQASNFLSHLSVLVQYNTFFEFIYYKLYGFIIAFSPWGKYSYSTTFHGFQYSIILILITLFMICLQQKNRKNIYKIIQDTFHDPKKYFLLFFIIFSLTYFLSIHMLHKKLWSTWNFPTRHALLCSFLFFLSFVYLLKQKLYPKIRKITLIVFLLATLIGLKSITFQTIRSFHSSNFYQNKKYLIHWLKKEFNQKHSLSVAMSNPQKISTYVAGINFHWIYHNTSLKDLNNLFFKLNIDYLILSKKEYQEIQKKIDGFNNFFFLQQGDLSGFFIFYPFKKMKRP